MIKFFVLAFCFALATQVTSAQTKRTAVKRTVKKRTTAKRTTNSKTKANIHPASTVDTVAIDLKVDSLPIETVKKSLRTDDAIERNLVKDRTPLAYENLREDDAVYRQKIWREIDIREKMNLPFRYSANENNGNQRFISILFKAIQDGPDNGGVTVFAPIDDRFTTPMTVGEVAKTISGGAVSVPIYDSVGGISRYETKVAEVNLDSFYIFRIKEEVIFDKESSRLFWRILGIAPVKNVVTSAGVNLGPTELFWVYYPDMRPIFAKYEAYNGKNYGARMTWEELFESRFFYGRVIKSTLDNPYNQSLSEYQGLKDSKILQLYEGENIKDKIFNYEQSLWSY
ncbi:MAG: gliding motility protein GldN [Chitinophagaceae bacterium]|nr:gliding motility protein GldN [Chitinophagaceae bacterium]